MCHGKLIAWPECKLVIVGFRDKGTCISDSFRRVQLSLLIMYRQYFDKKLMRITADRRDCKDIYGLDGLDVIQVNLLLGSSFLEK